MAITNLYRKSRLSLGHIPLTRNQSPSPPKVKACNGRKSKAIGMFGRVYRGLGVGAEEHPPLAQVPDTSSIQ